MNMANYTIADNKCLNDVLDVIPIKKLSGITGTTPWAQIMAGCSDGINIYALSECSNTYYPVEIAATDTQKAAIITITMINDISMNVTSLARIEFFYDGDIYTRQYKNASAQGATLTDWVKVTTTAVNNG